MSLLLHLNDNTYRFQTLLEFSECFPTHCPQIFSMNTGGSNALPLPEDKAPGISCLCSGRTVTLHRVNTFARRTLHAKLVTSVAFLLYKVVLPTFIISMHSTIRDLQFS